MLYKALSVLTLSTILATPVYARDNIQVAGSSTVLPYSVIVAETFGENFSYVTPVIESGGSSAGLKRFCEGVGPNTIDIANSSRRIKDSEIEICASNGVTDITEVRIGYDGIVFASDLSNAAFPLTPQAVYLALNSKYNYTNWNQIDPSYPDREIYMYIPGTKHGTREVFEEKVLIEGCKKVNGELTKEDVKACVQVRTDGRSTDIDGDYTETLARIDNNKSGIGVFGLAFYENNRDKLGVATMSGITPTVVTISSGEYPVSRPLYFYVKNAHLDVIPGLRDFINFFVSDDIAGDNGLLTTYGLVPDPELYETQLKVSEQ